MLRYLLISFYLFLHFCLLPLAAEGKTVMIIIDHLTLNDWQQMPGLKELSQESSIALMNTNTAKTKDPRHSYLTIGSGQKALAGVLGGSAFNTPELPTKLQLHTLRGEVCHLGFPEIINLNQEAKYQAHPGLLGNLLQKKQYTTAVFGNCDLFSGGHLINRPAVSIAANESGTVDFGNVSTALLRFNPNFPGNYSTDFQKLKQAYHTTTADFIVLETGDSSRLEDYQPFLSPDYYALLRKNSLQKIDNFLQEINSTLTSSDLLMIVAPTASKSNLKSDNSLTPVLIKGHGFSSGLLYSPTTHRMGIITNLDLAPTILDYFQIEKKYFLAGQALKSQPQADSLTLLQTWEKRITATAASRVPVLKTYVVLQITVLFLLVGSLFFKTHLSPRFFLILKQFALSFMFIPFFLLIFPLFKIFSTGLILALLSLSCFILLLVGQKVSLLNYFISIGLITSGTLILDLTTGQHLLSTSLLSYDPMIGARFYGIGNEYSGILLGSAILGSTALLEKYPARLKTNRLLVLFFFSSIIFFSSSPSYGADAGGAITSLFTFSLLSCYLWNKKIQPHIIGWIIISVLLFLSVLCLIDLYNTNNVHTHMGLAINSIRTEGFSNIWNIILNKLNTNLRLIRYTIWSRFLLTTIGALTVLFFCPVGIIKRIFDQHPILGKGLISISIASIVGFLVNDSGVVQAATTILYGIYPLICLVLEKTVTIPDTDNF